MIYSSRLNGQPIYSHDCDRCRLLATMFGHNGDQSKIDRVYDVYSCESDGEPSLICRFGNEPPMYDSFPISIAKLVAAQEPSGKWASMTDIFELRQGAS